MNIFYVDFERSLPTLYPTTLLLDGASLFGNIVGGHRRGAPYVGHWGALSLVFSLLALDEFAELHEQTIDPVRAVLDIEGGALWLAWVVPAAVAVALFGIAFARFLGHFPRATRRLLSAAAILSVGGAIGVELVGASYGAVHTGSPISPTRSSPRRGEPRDARNRRARLRAAGLRSGRLPGCRLATAGHPFGLTRDERLTMEPSAGTSRTTPSWSRQPRAPGRVEPP